MLAVFFVLFCALVIILIAAQFFSNGLEHFGKAIHISSGVTGSIFAAIATALPEASIPVLAIFAGGANQVTNEEISAGAILGAPLMLLTLSICVMALADLRRRGIHGWITPERNGIARDLNCFLVAFLIAAIALFTPLHPIIWRAGLGIILIALYVFYVWLTVRASRDLVKNGHVVTPSDPLFFTKLNLPYTKWSIMLQLLFGAVLLFLGAKWFIVSIEIVSSYFAVSALLLSLLIIPIATEFPEKVNSIFWIRKHQDTLGVGNITGATVFQGTILPALGILLTPWQPNKLVLSGVVITWLAAAWTRLMLFDRGFPIKALLLNVFFYIVYLGIAV